MRYIILLIMAAGISACASHPTAYVHASGADGYGYSESQLGDNRYRVTFSGNSSTSRNRVKDFALERAAQLTLRDGHEWFRVVGQDTDHESSSTPATTTTVAQPASVRRDCGLLGCTTSVTPAYTGVTVSTRHSRNRYTSSIEIVMGDGNPADPTTVYDASALYHFLDTKY